MRCACGKVRLGSHTFRCPTMKRVRRLNAPIRKELRAAQSAVDRAMRELKAAQRRLRRAIEAL